MLRYYYYRRDQFCSLYWNISHYSYLLRDNRNFLTISHRIRFSVKLRIGRAIFMCHELSHLQNNCVHGERNYGSVVNTLAIFTRIYSARINVLSIIRIVDMTTMIVARRNSPWWYEARHFNVACHESHDGEEIEWRRIKNMGMYNIYCNSDEEVVYWHYDWD